MGVNMIAKFEIILDKEEILKIHCIGKVDNSKLSSEKERLLNHGFIETEINYFKNVI